MLPQILPKCRRHLKSHSSQRKRPVSNFSWSINVLVGNCEMMLVEILCCLYSPFHFFYYFFFVSLTFYCWPLLYQALTSTFTHPHGKLEEQNSSVRLWQASTPSPYLSNARKPFQSCMRIRFCAYDIIDSDVHMCIGRKKNTRV